MYIKKEQVRLPEVNTTPRSKYDAHFRKEGSFMYENEIYSETGSSNGTSGSAAAGGEQNTYPAYHPASPAYGGDFSQDGSGHKKKKKERSGRGMGVFRKIALSLTLGLCFGLFAGLGFYTIQFGTRQFMGGEVAQSDERSEDRGSADSEEKSDPVNTIQPATAQVSSSAVIAQIDASDMVEKVMPAMVSIVNNYTEVGSYWGRPYQENRASSGSGIIVAQNDEELLIVTNYHVVEGTDQLVVTFIDNSEADAVIKGTDTDMDLAVVAVPVKDLSSDTKDAIAIAALGDSDELRLGEPVIAIGNALGYGQSVSGGMVSALERELTFDDGSKGTFIQTDAAINPGNSGGALFNLKGEVIGINSSKIGGTYVDDMGYAIPISAASPIIAELMERDTRTVKVDEEEKGYMGIQLQNITEEVSVMYNMPRGVFVYSVEPGTAAEAAGMKRGDIIVKFDGQRITSEDDLLDILQYYRAGETVTVEVKRLEDSEYQNYELEITLGKNEN